MDTEPEPEYQTRRTVSSTPGPPRGPAPSQQPSSRPKVDLNKIRQNSASVQVVNIYRKESFFLSERGYFHKMESNLFNHSEAYL